MSEPFLGEIRMFAGNFAPRGWALCDGQLLAVSQNDALFALLGTIYGGDGRSTFALPDLRGRIPIHQGTGPGLSPRPIGQKAGAETHTVNTAELPSHSHRLRGSDSAANNRFPVGRAFAEAGAQVYVPDFSASNMATQAIGQAGGSQSHTNVMPFLCVNFIIALFGIFPSRN